MVMPNIKTTTKISATLDNHTKLAIKSERKLLSEEEKRVRKIEANRKWARNNPTKISQAGMGRWGRMTEEQKKSHQESSKQSRLKRMGKV